MASKPAFRVVASAMVLLAGAWAAQGAAHAQSGASPAIVAPLGAASAPLATAREPDGAALVGSWRNANESDETLSFARQRIEVLDYRTVWQGDRGRAYLAFRVLPAGAGDAAAFAKALCKGRTQPIEPQAIFHWSAQTSGWVLMEMKGATCTDRRGWSAADVAALLEPPVRPAPPAIGMEDVLEPGGNAPERRAMLEAIRPRYEKLFGKPIQFQVANMRMAAGFAFVVVHPQRADRKPIEAAVWEKSAPSCEMDREDFTNEFWLKNAGGKWTILAESELCGDDSIIMTGAEFGAPPQIAGYEAWPE